ncbi:MAG TPA: SUMF1/EgtB/PvdO family nonheme iron enzyme [Bacteroidia bacterium]|jgi:sulfatase modifying factor 1|nr:SUMF1/EgtB/PvdO family nonheme iron enzyme [Bacteroidia bacterium]
MRRLLLLACFIAVITGCNKYDGQLIGVQGRPAWFQADPYGMVYIPMGSYMMGPDDQDVPYASTTKSRMVSVQALYMDDSEISNNEYRQFVNWVRDSIIHIMLFNAGDQDQAVSTDEYGNDIDPPVINWDAKVRMDDQSTVENIADIYLPEQERFYRRKEIDARKLNYMFYTINIRLAAEKSNRFLFDKDAPDKKGQSYINGKGHYDVEDNTFNTNGGYSPRQRKGVDRSVFIDKQVINVFPDTLAWVHDFTYSFNEPMTNMYFWHPAYDNYPVVGITWKQATAFCVWRTQLMDSYLIHNGESIVNDFRLPTEAEWEYCARGGLALSPYPWGGPYIRNSRGCFLCNFKPMRGSYMDDGGFHTVGIYSYNPNDWGLYCMAGNVAEWTSNAYDESAYDFSHDLNPNYVYDATDNEPNVLKRKVIRGGSWKDVGYYCETSTRTYEYQDTAKCYIGFRCVETYLGRAKGDNLDNVSSTHQ